MKLNKLLAWCGTLSCLFAPQLSADTVYLVRHAEKQGDSIDPPLSECGRARAQALAGYFANIPLAAVYATPYQRTRQTAAAVAAAKQLSVTDYDPRQSGQLVAQLTAQGQPVLVVGHSNTVPQLVSLLSDIEMAALTEQDYNLLYRVELGPQPAVMLTRQMFECDKQASE
ncbi:broad specificity phosphatase PhoE [Rheinheimera pacifica]|uniref:SixA phosphatase family protein n=1 Tax=Rheinheimera pacifica TaxID=173990 RepID=UPI002167A094|nr:phosphoglycerate mutase family protein [Rheinheimera pacifica]MCS4308552.1 broad specificity phosphatase PhoE [Rheinheimera pacifica]